MILQRYIAGNLLRSWVLVLLVIGSVFGLIAFITELERTRFGYDAGAVASYTLFTLPQQLVSLSPVIALLGSIVALAGLDRYNELTIISCAGVSRRTLLSTIALPTVALMLLIWAGLEYITPQMHQRAEKERHFLRYGGDIRIPDGGVWSRTDHRYIHLGIMTPEGEPGDIDIYEFDDSGQLMRAIHAQRAELLGKRRWLLKKVRVKQLEDGVFTTRSQKEMEVDQMWVRDELPTLTLTPDSMPLSVLYNYSQYLKANNQPWEKYIGAFWQKVALPLTFGAMVLLATPISASLGSKRNRGFGVSIGIGSLVGILFYLGTQIVFALGALLNAPTVLVAFLPTLVIGGTALILLRQMRW
jgi:lipopolysaccharide export system permease protein